jgi:hypothetical protein
MSTRSSTSLNNTASPWSGPGLSRLATGHPEISEVDVNPLKVTPQGALVAVDALIAVKPPEPGQKYPPPVTSASIARLFTPRSIAKDKIVDHRTGPGYASRSHALRNAFLLRIYRRRPAQLHPERNI